MTLSSNFALKRGGGGRNNEGGVTTREYGKCMVKYESGNGDLAVAARRRSPLNFTWPWLERRSVAAGWR